MHTKIEPGLKLVCLHEHARNIPVYVNPAYVTFVAKSSLRDGGTIIGLVADDLGCEVAESVADAAKLIGGEECVKDQGCGYCVPSQGSSASGPATPGDTGPGMKPGKPLRRFTHKAKTPRCGNLMSGSSVQGGRGNDTVNE